MNFKHSKGSRVAHDLRTAHRNFNSTVQEKWMWSLRTPRSFPWLPQLQRRVTSSTFQPQVNKPFKPETLLNRAWVKLGTVMAAQVQGHCPALEQSRHWCHSTNFSNPCSQHSSYLAISSTFSFKTQDTSRTTGRQFPAHTNQNPISSSPVHF